MANMDTIVTTRRPSTTIILPTGNADNTGRQNIQLSDTILAVTNNAETAGSTPPSIITWYQKLDSFKEAANAIKKNYDEAHKGIRNRLRNYNPQKMNSAADIIEFFNKTLENCSKTAPGVKNTLATAIEKNTELKKYFELIQNTKGKYQLTLIKTEKLQEALRLQRGNVAGAAHDPNLNGSTKITSANKPVVQNCSKEENLGTVNPLKDTYPKHNNPFEEDDYPKEKNPFEADEKIHNTQYQQPVVVTSAESTNSEVPVENSEEALPRSSDCDTEINKQQASLLLGTLNSYMYNNGASGKFTKEKQVVNKKPHDRIQQYLRESALLRNTFKFDVNEKICFEIGGEPTTTEKMDAILDAFRSYTKKPKSSLLIKNLNERYIKSYPKTAIAKTYAAEDQKKYDDAVEQAIKKAPEPHFMHIPYIFKTDKIYLETKNQCEEAAAEFYGKVNPDKAEPSIFMEKVKPFLEKIAHEERICAKAKKNGDTLLERTQVNPLDYNWKQTILSWVGYTDVNETTASFLKSEDKVSQTYIAKLSDFLKENIVSASKVGQVVVDKSNRGREKAERIFTDHYKGNKVNPFLLGEISEAKEKMMRVAIQAESNQTIANMILEAIKAYEQSFTDNLSNAIKKFNLEKVEDHANNRTASRVDTANDFNKWYGAFEEAVDIFVKTQADFYAVTETAMNQNLISENGNEHLVKTQTLAELRDQQEEHKLVIFHILTNKLLDDAAGKIVNFTEEINEITGGLLHSDDAKKNTRIVTALQKQLDAKKAITERLKANCERLNMDPEKTKTVIADFTKQLPQDAEIIGVAHAQLPEVKSIWRYLKTSFSSLGNPFNKTSSLLDKIPFLGALSGPIAKVAASGVSVAAVVLVGVAFGPIVAAGFLAGGLLGFIGWKIGTAFTARNANQEIHKKLEAIAAKSSNSDWEANWKNIKEAHEEYKGDAKENVNAFFEKYKRENLRYSLQP